MIPKLALALAGHAAAALVMALALIGQAVAQPYAVFVHQSNSVDLLQQAVIADQPGLTAIPGTAWRRGIREQTGYASRFDVPGYESLARGLVLSSHYIGSPNEQPTGSGPHALISALRGYPSFDQAVLGFSFTVDPGMTAVTALMMFATDEYPNYVMYPEAGDGLVVVVDGVNVATVNGAPFSGHSVWQHIGFRSSLAEGWSLPWNGLTPMLQFTAALDPTLEVHTVEFAIADVYDPVIESVMFVSGFRAIAEGTPGLALAVPEPTTWALWLGGVLLLARRLRNGRPVQDPGADV